MDWNLPIDHADTHGNTLLHVAVQNGSKRIAKLLLRRGASPYNQEMHNLLSHAAPLLWIGKSVHLSAP